MQKNKSDAAQALTHKGTDAFNRKDYKEAFIYYSKAAEQGDAIAQYMSGEFYYHGEGVPQDKEKAVYWYTQAAEQGNADAQRTRRI